MMGRIQILDNIFKEQSVYIVKNVVIYYGGFEIDNYKFN